MTTKRWLDTGYLRAKPEKIDSQTGVVTGVKVCSAGEAKGHGVHLEAEFIETVAKQGNGSIKGLKARFGHPNMCSESLGTYIGRFRNFSTGKTVREDGTEAACCFADLHLSETAKDTPNGDLYAYVLGMAEKEADMFGTSIVFYQGPIYRRSKSGQKVYPYDVDGKRNEEFRQAEGPDYIECKKLCACDCVDDPAANDGLFSVFARETVAGQITEFLDLHPQVFEVLTGHPEIMEAITQYGDKFDEFLAKYQEHRRNARQTGNQHQEENTMSKTLTAEALTLQAEQNPPVEEKVEKKELQQTAKPEEVDVEAKVAAALKVDRQRQVDIRDLGSKFGFTGEAEKFANSDKSVEEFRAHILEQSPEKWRASLAIKNPSIQASEDELASGSEGDAAVAKIKDRRQARYGSK